MILWNFENFRKIFALKIFDQIRKLVGFRAKLPERFPSEALSPKPGPNLARGLSPNHVTYTESSEKILKIFFDVEEMIRYESVIPDVIQNSNIHRSSKNVAYKRMFVLLF